MSIIFQIATESDKDFLLSLRIQTMTEHLERQGIFLSQEAHLSRIEEHYQYANIIYVNNEKVGCLRYKATVLSLEIMQIQVLPKFQNKGFGCAILKQLLGQYPHLPTHLSVLKESPAKRLYHKLGFVVHAEDEFEYFMMLLPKFNG
ncbi:GNAT family N-acetyltransferase [Pseudoalteromonas umbrosa]|uniref:GNAT family N-acetyltransferase n=1 Tax=Pseudoalteromonas umbrosa TaxID=3048489 RepID=UPI0024C222E3|nr:GNAT family N-acetyltransferase [Pseudoalteromonas sp. B95]MDK1288140.1 GNAT family N-acetyltransferase [Pseudoalteromonas sp. B95]